MFSGELDRLYSVNKASKLAATRISSSPSLHSQGSVFALQDLLVDTTIVMTYSFRVDNRNSDEPSHYDQNARRRDQETPGLRSAAGRGLPQPASHGQRINRT